MLKSDESELELGAAAKTEGEDRKCSRGCNAQ
jgi:hypothetical protein